MKLIQLTMTNFGNHKQTVIDFGPRSVFMGEHGEGKTTILDGIQSCIMAMCRAMTQRNQEKEMIREGAVKAELRLIFMTDNFDGKVIIDRKIGKTTSDLQVTLVSGKNTDCFKGVEAQDKIYEMLGFGPAIAAVLFKSTEAISMKPRELKSLLQELFTADESKIIKYLESQGIKDLPDSVKKDITDAFVAGGLGESKTKNSPGAYGHAYDKRLGYSQEIKKHQALTAPDIDKETQMQDPAKIEAKIQALKDERDQLLKTANVDTGKTEQLKASITRLKKEITALEKGFKDSDELKMDNHKAASAVTRAQTDLDEVQGKVDVETELKATLVERDAITVVDLKPLQVTADKAAAELRTSKDDLIKLEDMAIPITTDDRLNTTAEVLVEMGADASEQTIQALGARIAELPEFDHAKHQRDIASIKDWIASYEKDVIEAQNALTTARDGNTARLNKADKATELEAKLEHMDGLPTMEQVTERLKKAESAATTANKAFDDNATLDREINIKKRDLKRDEKDLAEIPKGAADPVETAKAVKSIDDRLVASSKMLADVATWKQYETDAATVKVNLDKAQGKHDNWDKITEALNPKTCDTMFLLGDSFNDFCKGFSATAKSLGIPATIGTDFAITGSVKRDDDLMASKDVAWLNRAHHGLVGIALQLAICQQVGFRSLIIDDGDTFLGDSRNKLSSMLLMKPIKDIDSMVLLSAGVPPTEPSKVDGLAFYAVQSGSVTTAEIPFA